jgi:tripartite ATP-independent transporter DctM subunit
MLLSLLYIIYIALLCFFSKTAAPAISVEELNITREGRLKRAAIHMVPAMILIVAVLGSIIAGVATPTEASGVGAFVAMILTAVNGKLTWQNFRDVSLSTLTVTSMVFFIIIFAGLFNSIFLFLGGGALVQSALISLPFGKWVILFFMMFILFLGGFFISWQGLLFVAVPILLPVSNSLGFDPLWFALLVCLNLQMSLLTPPFAYSIFFVKGVAPPEVKTVDIYRGVLPFVGMQIVAIILCILFPEIILWLPEVTLGG